MKQRKSRWPEAPKVGVGMCPLKIPSTQKCLKSSHAAALAEDPLKSDGEDSFRALQDETTAKAIATAAPLGVARELARATAARQTP